MNLLIAVRWSDLTALDWVALGVATGGIVTVWGSLMMMRWSRPKARRWDGKEIV